MFGRLYRFVMEDLDPDGHVKTENAKVFGKLLEFTRPGPDVAGMHAVRFTSRKSQDRAAGQVSRSLRQRQPCSTPVPQAGGRWWSGGVVQGEPWLMRGHARRRDGASHVPWR